MSYMLMPSEVARLVYGYINDLEGCQDVARQFLQVCPHLREFANGIRLGARYSAKINNLTLLDYLNNQSDNDDSDSNSSLNHSGENKQSSKNVLNQEVIITSLTNVITKTLECAADKQTEKHHQSLQKFVEDREQFKSALITSLQNEINNKMNELMHEFENTFRSLSFQNNTSSHYNHSHISECLKTPKNNSKYSPYVRKSGVSFSTAAHSSPRRKSMTPKRLSAIQHQHSVHNSPATSTSSQNQLGPLSNFSSQSEAYSSPCGTEYSEIDVHALIDKQTIVNKFLQTTTSDEKFSQKIANTINYCIKNRQPQESLLQQTQQTTNSEAEKNPIMEMNNFNSLIPEQFEQFIDETANALNENSEIQQFVDNIILTTPFKLYNPATPSSSGVSNSSLNTPNIFPDTPDGNSSNKENGNTEDSDSVPVKNLLKDLSHHGENVDFNNLLNNSTSINNSQLSNCSDSSIQTVIDNRNGSQTQNSQKKCTNDHFASTLNLSSNKVSHKKTDSNTSSIKSSDKDLIEHSNTNKEVQRPKRTISKPVFYNQHLNSNKRSTAFLRLKNDQKFIQESMNYTGPSEANFGVQSNKDKPSKPTKSSPKTLTTTIDKVDEANKCNKKTLPVHSIDSSMIQISNNQIHVINNQQLQTPTISLIQQSDQFCFSTTGPTLWDPSVASNPQPVIVLSGDYAQLQGSYNHPLSINPQIISTSQNVYYPIESNTEQHKNNESEQQPQQSSKPIIESPQSSMSTNHSMPILTNLANHSKQIEKTGGNESSANGDKKNKTRTVSPRRNTTKPDISKSKKKQRSSRH